MIGTLSEKKEDNELSSYSPSQEVKDLTLKVKEDYQVGFDILHRPFTEFNDMSLVDRMDVDQKAWNGYVQPKTDDPDEEWRWNGVTPITRNKVMLTLAHLVAGMMYPGVFAQNDQDEEDRTAAYIMRDLMEWNIRHSDYELSFLYGVLAMLVNPVAYLHVDYNEVYQSIKMRQADGSIARQQVIDEVLSGLQIHNVPADEILIANPYEYHLQRQRFAIRRKFNDYDEMEAKHGDHENWQYVTPGTKAFYNESDGMFYDQKDENSPTLCEEVIYYNRREDLEVPFVNGIYMGDADVGANPMKHRDNKGRPRIPYVKYGAEPIDEKRFYFYKSLVARLANRQEVADQQWRMAMDGTFLGVMSPLAVIGGGTTDSDLMFPGGVTNFPPNTKIERLADAGSVAVAWNALDKVEESMTESSQDPQRGGMDTPGAKTAHEADLIERNARINLGVVGRMIMKMVREVGDLMIDCILKYQTVGEMTETGPGGETAMKYKTFLLSDQEDTEKDVSKKIIFDSDLIGKRMTDAQTLDASYDVLEEQGGIDGETKISRVNPVLFSRMKFLTVIDPEAWIPKNTRVDQLWSLEIYDRAMADPFSDKEKVSRDFLYRPLMKGKAGEYMLKDKEAIARNLAIMPPGEGKVATPPLEAKTAESLTRE